MTIPTRAAAPAGAILLGGAHGALALARQLRRKGMTVWLVSDDTPLPRFSRAFARHLHWPGAKSDEATAFLERLAAEGARGFVLVACADADVRFLSMARERLMENFEVLLPDWAQLRWACDKSLMQQRATELGLASPTNYAITTEAEAAAADIHFPVVLKPALRLARNRFTVEKAWQADDREGFLALYREAAALVGTDQIVVQELVPGDGDTQLSYAGLWRDGAPVLQFTACRRRQYPLDFSYTSTFVETVDAPDVVAAAETFLRSIGHHGLVEIEFKRDARDGRLKMLDVNPRPWSWMSLAAAAGIDFAEPIAHPDRPAAAAQPRLGVAWVFAVRDAVAASKLRARRALRLRDYLRSLRSARAFATFSPTDPLPALIEMPLTLYRVLGRRWKP